MTEPLRDPGFDSSLRPVGFAMQLIGFCVLVRGEDLMACLEPERPDQREWPGA